VRVRKVVSLFLAASILGWTGLVAACGGSNATDTSGGSEPASTATSAPQAQASGPTPTPATIAPQEVTFQSGDLTLAGFLYRPTGSGPFPAILYNHGGEKLPGDKNAVAQVFVKAGYVVFVPHRRGQGRSPGPYIQDQLGAERQARGAQAQNALFISLHEGPQLSDQMAALDYLKRQIFVNPNRIAVVGCSYGGIQTILAAERGAGLRAAVAFAPGAQSWAAVPQLRDRLLQATSAINIPVFLLQAENDFDLTPTKALAAEFQRLGKPFTHKIFPPYGTSNADGHGGFCSNGGDVWGTEVLAFLSQNLK